MNDAGMYKKIKKFFSSTIYMENVVRRSIAVLQHKDIYSFSQAGEDRIINFVLQRVGIYQPSYLDIGANYPALLSNTFLFYQKGGYGVCIEPDPELFHKFKKQRRRDVCLNVGIGVSEVQKAPFYVFEEPAKGLNTFSQAEAEIYTASGKHKIARIIDVPLKNVNDVIKDHFKSYPNILSIDVEGLDYDILKTLDTAKYPIQVICAETITYNSSNEAIKTKAIDELMLEKGYFVFADTYINTIYVNTKAYNDNTRGLL